MFSWLRPKTEAAKPQNAKSSSSKAFGNVDDLTYSRMREMLSNGDFPIELADAVRLAVLARAADSAASADSTPSRKESVAKVFEQLPPRHKKRTKVTDKLVEEQITQTKDISAYDATIAFGDIFRKLPSFGFAWFLVTERTEKESTTQDRWLGIGPEAIKVLDSDTLHARKVHQLVDLKRFAASPTFITLDFENKGRMSFSTSEADQMEHVLSLYLERLWKQKRKEMRERASKKMKKTRLPGDPVEPTFEADEEPKDGTGCLENLCTLAEALTSGRLEDLLRLNGISEAFKGLSDNPFTPAELQRIAGELAAGIDQLLRNLAGLPYDSGSVPDEMSVGVIPSLATLAFEGLGLLLLDKGLVPLGRSELERAARVLAAGVKDMLATSPNGPDHVTLAHLDALFSKLDFGSDKLQRMDPSLWSAAQGVRQAIVELTALQQRPPKMDTIHPIASIDLDRLITEIHTVGYAKLTKGIWLASNALAFAIGHGLTQALDFANVLS